MRTGASVVTVLAMAACGDGDSFDGLLQPPPADDGQQLDVKIHVEPGQEMTVCKNFALPPGTFEIGKFEHAMTAASHHLLVFPILLGTSEVTDEVFPDCDENPEAQGDRVGFIYGSQTDRGEVTFPSGYAMLGMSGIAIQLEFHIFNAGDEPIEAEAAVNLWQAREEIVGDGGTLFAYNNRIALPPMSTGSARQRCLINDSLKLINLVPHMHSRGTAMQVFLDREGSTPQLVVDAHGWDEDTVTFDPPLDIQAGDVLDVRCEYNNATSEFVTDGASAKHSEMCVTGGLYYRDGARLKIQDEVCFGEGIVYSGTKSCTEIEQCERAIDYSGSWSADPSPGDLYDACVSSGCQAGAAAYLRLDTCRFDQCRAMCFLPGTDGPVSGVNFDSAECQACVDVTCPQARDACPLATCP